MGQQVDAGALAPGAMERFRRWAAIAVGVAVLGYLVYAVFRGLSETASALAEFRWSLYVPVLLLTLVNYSLRFFKWHYLLGRLGVRVPVRDNLWVFGTGLAMVISPGKAGELVKPYLIRVMTNTPMARTLPALVTERATDDAFAPLRVLEKAVLGVFVLLGVLAILFAV